MEPRFAFLFPGQGAQYVGMAVDLAGACAEARAVFERGREILGVDVFALCRDGPAPELDSTRVSQPAIFLHSMAALEILSRRRGAGPETYGAELPAQGAAGLSLGEYSALVFAGTLEFEEALRLVGRRGELMQAACDEFRGTMASVLGLAAEQVEEVVAAARDEGAQVWVANNNSPEQTVISGTADGVRQGLERLRAAGARRAVELRVAGAYHSPLMARAARGMAPLLDRARLKEPRVPFFANVWGEAVRDPEEIRRGLKRQIENPVRWERCVRGLAALGARSALEVGPGTVLKGLARQTVRDLAVIPAGTMEALEGLDPSLLERSSASGDSHTA